MIHMIHMIHIRTLHLKIMKPLSRECGVADLSALEGTGNMCV